MVIHIMEPMQVLAESTHQVTDRVKSVTPWYRLTRRQTISMYFMGLTTITVLAVYLGVTFLTLPRNLQIRVSDYDTLCAKQRHCNITVRINNELRSPVYVYYELENFITTRKNYIISRNNRQLRGRDISMHQAYQCEPYRTNREMGVTKSWKGFDLNPDDVASPCGMQAYYFFRDTFALSQFNEPISIRRTGLISSFQRSPSSQHTQWVDPTLDAFEIWMSSSVSYRVEKLYGVIDQDLQVGEYNLTIENTMYLNEAVIKNLELTHQQSNFRRPQLFGWVILGGAVIMVGAAAIALAAMEDQPFCR